MQEKKLKFSRIMYILEAAFEYLLTIPVTGAYLATLTGYVGMSDSLTGIMSSVVSLGCLFQLLSLLFHPQRVKPVVIALSILNQILFMLLYMVPFIKTDTGTKNVIFVVLIISAYFIYNVAHPKKISWLMSLVQDGKRGSFTANKEIVSLIIGMVFTLALGNVIDAFNAVGNVKGAFILCGLVMLTLMLLHTITLFFSVEPEVSREKATFKNALKVLKDKNVLKITVVFILWNIAKDSALPFYGSYQIKELGFSLGFISVITVAASLSRVLVSRFWGKYADKHSFSKMIIWCFLIAAASFAVAAFSVPSNGRVMQTVHNILQYVAMGGINSALINLVFDYVKPKYRGDALAVNQALSGLAGFITTVIAGGAVSYIQQKGYALFGVSLYAQQLLSIFACLVTLCAAAYVYFSLVKKGDEESDA